jgi:branched-chain amino acid transport system permease protein
MDYVFHVLFLVGIYSILAVSLNLVAGHTGLLSIAHAAFYGIGAYVSALLLLHFGTPFPLCIVAGMVTAALVSLLISVPTLHLRNDYFAIATFGFQMIVFGLLNNWVEVTRGPFGVAGIPRPNILGYEVASERDFLLLSAVIASLTYTVSIRISKSPFGRVLRAIREDDIYTASVGKRTAVFKVTIYAISAALGAAAGGLYAHYVTYIDPTSFTVMESILILSVVIVGGAGSHAGPLVGAVGLVLLPELLRFIGLPGSVAANLRQIIYFVALVACLLWRPQGLIREYTFQKEGNRR